MRLGGGVPGAGHSVLRPGATAPDRWTWDALGEAEVPDEAARLVLSLAGRSSIHAVVATPDASSVDDGNDASEEDELRPLGHYTFDTDETAPEPDRAAGAASRSTEESAPEDPLGEVAPSTPVDAPKPKAANPKRKR